MYEEFYDCVKCGKRVSSQIFPSDGIRPECRAGQSKAEFNGNILIDGGCGLLILIRYGSKSVTDSKQWGME